VLREWCRLQARLKNPKNEELWLAAVRTEQRAGNAKAAETLMAKALQDCPTSGPLNAEAVAMAPRPQRRARSLDALKRCNDDPHIIAAVAQLFWNDRKVCAPRQYVFGNAEDILLNVLATS
jgi:pre-mRNA-processing factor 6